MLPGALCDGVDGPHKRAPAGCTGCADGHSVTARMAEGALLVTKSELFQSIMEIGQFRV